MSNTTKQNDCLVNLSTQEGIKGSDNTTRDENEEYQVNMKWYNKLYTNIIHTPFITMTH